MIAHTRFTRLLPATALPLMIGAAALGAIIEITPTLELRTGSVEGILNDSMDQFGDDALSLIQSSLANADVDTDGRVTVLGLDTDQGISVVFLVDSSEMLDGVGDSSLSFQTTAPIGRMAWTNDQPDEINDFYHDTSGNQTAYGTFSWNSITGGDAFAWTDLEFGDEINSLFAMAEAGDATFPGLDSTDTFQFVSWNDEGGWFVAENAEFTSAGLYGFSAQVIPAPGAIALLGLAIIARRRRNQQ